MILVASPRHTSTVGFSISELKYCETSFVLHFSFYTITTRGIYRVVERESGLRAELYNLTNERRGFVESLIPGRKLDQVAIQEWLDVADIL
jgi:hypothetical protein